MIAANATTTPKRWFSDGATMDHPRRLRTFYWAINLGLFILLNMFDLRMRTGLWLHLTGPFEFTPLGALIPTLLSPINIFHHPTQIIVIGAVMALVCTVPILTALLYNFWHALPFVLVVHIVGHNPILSLCLLASCAAVSFDPFRFKSKFVAAALWLSPEVLYWALYSGENPEQDVLRWAVLYAPWGIALMTSLGSFGVVICIGHFLRYRPGVLMPLFGFSLAGIVMFFHFTIGMNEYDFQTKVFRNSPDQNSAFQTRSILPLLEEEAAQRFEEKPYLKIEGIKDRLRTEWRWAFLLGLKAPSSEKAKGEVIRFYSAQLKGIKNIRDFITAMNPQNKRVHDALYYLACLYDVNVDLRTLRDEDVLRAYHDLPSPSGESQETWQKLLDRHRDADVAIEARWRLAHLMAQSKPQEPTEVFQFDRAVELLNDARERCDALIAQRRSQKPHPFWESRLGKIFTPPPPTITTDSLIALHSRIGRLLLLLDNENRTGHRAHDERLADFVALDPHQLNYEEGLTKLRLESPKPDPLLDNIELAQVLLIQDIENRMDRLTLLTERYDHQDGGLLARLELARLLLDERRRSDYLADQQHLLTRSREHLQTIIANAKSSDAFIARTAQDLLKNNPIE